MAEAKPCIFPGCRRYGPDGLCVVHIKYKGMISQDSSTEKGKSKQEKDEVEEKPVKKAKTLPLASLASKKKNSKIKPRSKKMAKVIAQLRKEVPLFLAKPENKYCAIQIEGVCTRVATVVNHTKGRGVNLLNQKDWQACCVACNGEAEKQHAVAKERGAKLPIHGTGEKYKRPLK